MAFETTDEFMPALLSFFQREGTSSKDEGIRRQASPPHANIEGITTRYQNK